MRKERATVSTRTHDKLRIRRGNERRSPGGTVWIPFKAPRVPIRSADQLKHRDSSRSPLTVTLLRCYVVEWNDKGTVVHELFKMFQEFFLPSSGHYSYANERRICSQQRSSASLIPARACLFSGVAGSTNPGCKINRYLRLFRENCTDNLEIYINWPTDQLHREVMCALRSSASSNAFRNFSCEPWTTSTLVSLVNDFAYLRILFPEKRYNDLRGVFHDSLRLKKLIVRGRNRKETNALYLRDVFIRFLEWTF